MSVTQMSAIRMKDWQVPNFEMPDSVKLGWVREAIEDGTTWMTNQCATDDISAAIDILNAGPGTNPSSKWSNIRTGDLKRGVREVVETLANIRPFWGYTTDNKAYLDLSSMMNKATKAIYLECFVDRTLRDSLQYAAITGAGFMRPGYARKRAGMGKGEFTFTAYGQPDILPVQLPQNRDYQEAYAVTISDLMPVFKAHALFPAYQSKLAPFAKQKYLKGGQTGRLNKQVNSRWKAFRNDGQIEQYCEVFYTYINDARINTTGAMIPMGQVNTSWYYEVPYVGQEITRWEDGKVVTRSAMENDCYVYPQRRLQISCDAALMYDGPGFDQHGMVPLIPFYMDDWAGQGTGFSLFKGTIPLQEGIDALVRSVYRIAMSRANPSRSYNSDITTGTKQGQISTRQAESIDPLFSPDSVFAVDGDIADAIMRPIMPEWCYNIPEWVPQTVEFLQQAIKTNLGLDQIQSLEKLRSNVQNPEDLLDAEGPVVIGTSRSMERGLRDLGEMTKFNVLQYMSTAEMIQYVGADGVAKEVFDYAADSIFPSHMPGEMTMQDGAAVPSVTTPQERVKLFANGLKFQITPHSLHYIAQREMKLNTLALLGKGVPVDPETIAGLFDIPNWGSLDGATIQEKVFSWAQIQVEEKGKLAHLELEVMPPPPPEPGAGGGAPNPSNGGGSSAPGIGPAGDNSPAPSPISPPAAPVGRPPTFASLPRAEQKGTASGGRVVMNTSRKKRK